VRRLETGGWRLEEDEEEIRRIGPISPFGVIVKTLTWALPTTQYDVAEPNSKSEIRNKHE
jgi:hypothetical protein